MVSISLAALAGSVLLAGINASVRVTDDGMNETIAMGMAQQLMDEVVGNRWTGTTTSGRANFDDIEDYANYQSTPPADPWNVALGTDDGQGGQRQANFRAPSGLLDRWKQQVLVYPVDAANPSVQLASSSTSECRAVEVRILYADPSGWTKELVRLRRVISHVTSLP
jgi:hypothetical protein